jgi:hypothetical protein
MRARQRRAWQSLLKAPKIYSKKLIIAMMRIFFNLLIGDENEL